MLFKENANKLLSISRMAKEEYVPKEEEPEKILNETVPKAMQIFKCSLSDGFFCDVSSTPLAFLARQVGDILVVEHQCTDSAAGQKSVLDRDDYSAFSGSRHPGRPQSQQRQRADHPLSARSVHLEGVEGGEAVPGAEGV